MNSLTEAEAYLLQFTNHERTGPRKHSNHLFSLAPLCVLLSELDDPHLRTPTLHIAGTDGKGSVAAILTSLLVAAGYRVGTYTSPHLVSICERIAVDTAPIPPEQFVIAVSAVAQAHDTIRARGELPATFFELVTAAAWQAFRTVGVDWIVLETGLGGRLDATNLAQPHGCVITPIGLEHTVWLGTNLVAIAGEKLGIIKPGVPWVSAPQSAELVEVFETHAQTTSAPLTWAHEHCQLGEVQFCSAGGMLFRLRTPLHDYGELVIPLAGAHQCQNAMVAITLLELVLEQAQSPSWCEKTRLGLGQVRWQGRSQVIHGLTTAPVVLDGAHSTQALRALRATLDGWFPQTPRLVIFGCMQDKHPGEGLAALLQPGDRLVLTRSQKALQRAADPNELAPTLTELAVPVTVSASVAEALRQVDDDGWEGVVVVTGSLYLVGEALAEMPYQKHTHG